MSQTALDAAAPQRNAIRTSRRQGRWAPMIAVAGVVALAISSALVLVAAPHAMAADSIASLMKPMAAFRGCRS